MGSIFSNVRSHKYSGRLNLVGKLYIELYIILYYSIIYNIIYLHLLLLNKERIKLGSAKSNKRNPNFFT